MTKAIKDQEIEMPYWIEIIKDMVDGLGFSYSRIAMRVGVSPSAIQKLMVNWNRQPRHLLFHKLMSLHHKLFFGPYRLPKAEAYLAEKAARREEELKARELEEVVEVEDECDGESKG